MHLIKIRHKILFVLGFTILSVLIFQTPAFACSGVYVGCDANDQGTSLVARSSDSASFNKPVSLKVFGGKDGEKLEEIEADTGFIYKFDKNIYRFICSPANEVCDKAGYYAFAINECGVSISSTVTGFCTSQSLKFNPYVENGLGEDVIPLIVGAQAKTAREGIEILAQIIDENGSAESNILMISDQNECWYMEIYGGHQYCAVKAPNDCVACIGNEFAITTEYKTCEDAICSPKLFTLPQDNSFAEYDSNGNMNIYATYAGKNRYTDFSHLRTWIGHHIMSPSTVGEYSSTMYLPLFYKPDKKISVADVTEIFRNRYEGTQYCPETNNRDDIRTIATEEQTKTHILQTYKNAEPNICAIAWYCPNCTEFGNFVPLSNCQNKFADSYTNIQEKYELDENNASSVMKELNALCCQNRKQLSTGVRDYWKFFENYEMEIIPQLIKNKNKEDLNNFCKFAEEQTYNDSKRLIKEINWYLMTNTITWKKDINTETYEYSDHPRPNFISNIDVALLATITGWNIEEMKIQQRNSQYDHQKAGLSKQADNGGEEGYIKLSKNEKTIEINTTNGHADAHGKLNINGTCSDLNATLSDGKIFAPFEIVNIFCEKDYKNFNDFSATFNTTQNMKDNQILGFPIWIKVTLIVISIFVIFLIGLFIGKKQNRKKK